MYEKVGDLSNVQHRNYSSMLFYSLICFAKLSIFNKTATSFKARWNHKVCSRFVSMFNLSPACFGFGASSFKGGFTLSKLTWSKFNQLRPKCCLHYQSCSKFLIAVSRFWREILITHSYFQDNGSYWWAVFCFCNLYLSEEGWGQGKGVFGHGTGCAATHKVVPMLLYYKNFIGMNIKIINADSSEFPTKCPCAFVYIYLC